jgi:hypothetical protein
VASDPLVTKRRKAVTNLTGVVYNVNPALHPLLRPINDITPDPDNSRHHPERSLIDIANSYLKFGQQRPIVIRPDGMLIAGEGQWVAARDRLSWTHIAAIVFDIGRPLTPDELAAVAEEFGLVDNRSAEQSEWDYENLGQKLVRLKEAGIDLSELGWLPHESSTIMLAEWKPPNIEDLNQNHGVKYGVQFTANQWKLVQAWQRHLQQRQGQQVDMADAVLDAITACLPPGERKVAAR